MGYLKASDVVLNGSVEEGGVAGEARAVLGNGKVRYKSYISLPQNKR